MSEPAQRDEQNKHWLVRRSTIRMLTFLGLAILAAITALDAVIHGHPHFGVDSRFGFYSAYGFLSGAAIVIFGKFLSLFLKRKDTYYDE